MAADYDQMDGSVIGEPEYQLGYLVASLIAQQTGGVPSEQAVLQQVLKIRQYADERSLIARVMGAVVIRSIIKGVSYETSSKRYVITFRADGSDRDETIRSDRTDGRYGHLVQQLFGREGLVGKRALIYKTHEQNASDKEHPVGYRICPYIRVFN